ncbi:hypothetical protein AB0M43_36660 [Longispora sp. NPDC051575]|uniref:hypothetical protein n=1 Tax=Longispora sp. NPDC051575 TaxID=3154943 RepID=UPI00343D6D9E
MADATVIAARRYADAYPGFRLAFPVEVAVPMSRLTLELLVQERRPLPVVEEYALRLTHAGVTKIGDIARYLGLDDAPVTDAIVAQMQEENLEHRPDPHGGRMLVLTPNGIDAATDLQAVTILRVEAERIFDRLAWKAVDYTARELIHADDVKADGIVTLPSTRTGDVDLADITPRALNKLLNSRSDRREPPPLQILSVETILRETRWYLPAVLLVYQAIGANDTRFAVTVNGARSTPYEQALDATGGYDRLKINIQPSAGEPALPIELTTQRVAHDRVVGWHRQTAWATPATPGDVSAETEDSKAARHELDTAPVRAVPAFEHRHLLAEALTTARRRLLLVTSSVRDAVAGDFFDHLETALRRKGMRVTIVYTNSDNRSDHDRDAIGRLRKLAERHTNLTLVAHPGPASAALIYDNTWINSNFGWLSYRGDPTHTYRSEEGTLIRIPAIVDAHHDTCLATFVSPNTA